MYKLITGHSFTIQPTLSEWCIFSFLEEPRIRGRHSHSCATKIRLKELPSKKKIKYFEEKKGGMDELHKKDDEIHIEKCHYKVDFAIWKIIEHFLAYKALSE